MNKSFKICIFSLIIACFLIQIYCKQDNKELPKSYYNFPIDTTVQIIQSLPSEVNESSGIIHFNKNIWTHNDSGDDPIVYELSVESGKILRRIKFENASARDWEDITQDSQFIYVSDLGNNGGKRRDLAIFKVSKQDVLQNDKVQSFKLNITYPDRTDFKPPAYQHNFDCEAMIAFEDSLYIFSKNHLDKHCRFYSLANNISHQTVKLHARFDTKGMITGAAVDTENKILALLGYNLDPYIGNFGPFVWLFWDFQNQDFFSGKSKRVNLPLIVQAEGICFLENGQFMISTETTRTMRGKLMILDAKKWMDE